MFWHDTPKLKCHEKEFPDWGTTTISTEFPFRTYSKSGYSVREKKQYNKKVIAVQYSLKTNYI